MQTAVINKAEWEAAVNQQQTQQDKPAGPRDWTIGQIIGALSKPLPTSMLKTRKQGGANLIYIPWHTVNRVLDKYAPGWTWEITSTIATPDRLIVTGRITIPAQEGNIYREATGTELLKEDKPVMIPNPDNPDRKIALIDELGRTVLEPKEIAYGDPGSNAESQCFRRCAARFGLGLSLYDKK
jgi:hypothetical protein